MCFEKSWPSLTHNSWLSLIHNSWLPLTHLVCNVLLSIAGVLSVQEKTHKLTRY